ncbi:Glutathione gamma-glutamylcysteinyltransferase 1 [Pleodorina starrii]|uniref:glutathione gamma-glutamylcysteinyltransferase n=1 Tax=Pleodorina starrii TaxID=330485 RepID=A0A9W6F9Y8_9CHLO|nr:Glutathione gamma-glutamylcysteinyltransferase 1 [Pleodorina starrii]GLC61230.1 Glutathione gamma-glutamylcysteinyltransferase 1 [Pleodorina starrii]GLC76891.1 Glutathione gamma-glutamylcysteinyltransferase 1 [Pleodorina starrii]
MAQSGNKRTYYKRELPSPPAIAFSSAQGREVFAEALQLGTMVGFFKLIEQFITQEEPQYCGLAAVSMTLNALGIDPRRTWKGAWRWFTETMLDCCKTMEDIKRDGITLNQAACLARCNGADVSVHRYGTFDGLTFRRLLREVCASEDRHMVVSYSRKTFQQSGDGHFSPVGGYNPQRDMVLILDVARFKYSPHWVAVDELMEAMGHLDPAIGRPRGFMLLSSRCPRESALFSMDLDLDPGPHADVDVDVGLGQRREMDLGTAQHALSELAAAQDRPRQSPCKASGLACAAAADLDTAAERPTGVGSCSGGDSTCLAPAPPQPSPEPRWAAAHRFLMVEAPALLAQLLAEPDRPEAAGLTGNDGGESDTAGHGEEEEEEDAAESAGGATSSSEGERGRSRGGVPSLDSLVCSLVAAAPLESVCALLTRRPPLAYVGQLRRGPCCSCCLMSGGDGGGEAAGAGLAVVREEGTPAAAVCTAAAPDPPSVRLAPCNSSLRGARCGGKARRGPKQRHLLTEAAVAAVEAAAGVAAAAAGGTMANPLVGGMQVDCAASQPRSLPVLTASVFERCRSDNAGCSPVAASLAGDAGVGPNLAGAAGGPGFTSVQIDSSASLSSRSDAGSLLDSAGASESSLTGSLSSGHSSCCHGEPLEHHCVPPQVQTLVADELRFTNMFKLVDYWLRRHRGCNHVSQPDITAFMRPAGAAAIAAAATVVPPPVSAPAVSSAVLSTHGSDPSTAAHCAGSGGGGGGGFPAPARGEVQGGKGERTDGGCGCDLGLPDLAAEKLAAALLLLSEADGWPLKEQPHPQSNQQKDEAAPAPASGKAAEAAAPGSVAPGGVPKCGRPRCRKCRRRAAAAGDRAAALEELREQWAALMRMAPLGLFASAPVLKDELSYLRLQLAAVGQCQG